MEEKVIQILSENKIKNIQVLNTNFKGSIINKIIIGSFLANDKNTRATALKIKEILQQELGYEINLDGEFPGDWIILDLGEIFIELLTEEKREYYNLEKFWGENKTNISKLKSKIK